MVIAALAKYKRKNRIVLYSTIASLADAVGSHLNKENIQLLLTPLMDTWKALKDDDKDLLSLMKCLASVAKAVQLGFLCYYIMVFNRCISIMQHNRHDVNIYFFVFQFYFDLTGYVHDYYIY